MLSSAYSQVGKEENRLSVFPVLARMDYQHPVTDRLSVSLGLGIGGYVFHSTCTTTQIHTWVQDSAPWKRGDVSRGVSRVHLTAAAPGAEASIGLAHQLGPSVSLGVTLKVLATSKIDDTWESTGYYAADWDPAEDELMTIKNGYQYGGMGWGIGASISF